MGIQLTGAGLENYSHLPYTVSAVCNVLSIGGCVSVLAWSFGWRDQAGFRADVHTRIARILLLFDALTAGFLIINPNLNRDGVYCKVQAILVYQAYMCMVLWHVVIGNVVWRWIVKRRDITRQQGQVRTSIIVCFVLSAIANCILIGKQQYAFDGTTCFVKNGSLAHALSVELPIILTWIYNITVFLAVTSEQRKRRLIDLETGISLYEYNAALRSVSDKLLHYLVAFTVCNVVTVTGFTGYVNVQDETLTLLNLVLTGLRGFVDACIYGGLFSRGKIKWLQNQCGICGGTMGAVVSCCQRCSDSTFVGCCCYGAREGANRDTQRTRSLSGSDRPTSTRRRSTRWEGMTVRDFVLGGGENLWWEDVSLFITTLNVGESSVKKLGSVRRWIPQGYDIYAVGMQEVIQLAQLRECILQYLGGSAEYRMYTNEIGQTYKSLGYHGHIALTVFVRQTLVSKGAVVEEERVTTNVRRGKNLVLRRASNKGAVGLAFRVYDARVAFLSAHMAADSKGKRRAGKRNADSREILARTVLVGDDNGIDAQLSHHHLFVLGDLNYRVSGLSPAEILDRVSRACAAEKKVWGGLSLGVARKCLAGDEEEEERAMAQWVALSAAAGGSGVPNAGRPRQTSSESTGPGSGTSLANATSETSDNGGQVGGAGVGASQAGLEQPAKAPVNAGWGSVVALASRLATLVDTPGEGPDANGATSSVAPQASAVVIGDLACEHLPFLKLTWRDDKFWLLLDPSVEKERDGALDTSAQGYALHDVRPLWEAVLEHDELTGEFQRNVRSAFLGFEEAQIAFPPSFRRKRFAEGACGDYSDAARLKKAYTTSVKERGAKKKGASPPPQGEDGVRYQVGGRSRETSAATATKRAIRSALGSVDEGAAAESGRGNGSSEASQGALPSLSSRASEDFSDSDEDSDEDAPAPFLGTQAAKFASSAAALVRAPEKERLSEPTADTVGGDGLGVKGLRPPSWTDRILWHSLPDKRERLEPGSYELCDALLGSDHRPVCGSFTLKVNPAVKSRARGSHIALATLTISDIVVSRLDSGSISWDRGAATSSHGAPHAAPAAGGSELSQADAGNDSPQAKKGETPMFIDFVFPLPAEDPILNHRRVINAAAIMGLTQEDQGDGNPARAAREARRSSASLPRRRSSRAHSPRLIKENRFDNLMTCDLDLASRHGVGMTAHVWPAVGMHAVVKLTNALGQDRGQAILSLSALSRTRGTQVPLPMHVPLGCGGGLVGWLDCLVELTLEGSSSAMPAPRAAGAAPQT